jgi:sn-glycerol 3-phosphate transport system substrate-binding protein
MPFNISNPVLFYNKKAFAKAGLDPNKPPASLDELRADSEKIVQTKASSYGLALESGFDSGGGWYVEQWFAKAQQFYLDGQNGRQTRATKVLYNDATGVQLLTFLQKMLTDKLAINVGDNTTTGYDNLLKLADKSQPAAMSIATSASLGPVLQVLSGGQFPNILPNDVGVGPMPGPDGKPGALIGGASLWVVNSGDKLRTAAAWDFITYLVGAQQQSTWGTETGYVPVRADARDLEPFKSTIAKDPRFAVAADQLAASPDAPTSAGPVTGPLREVRTVLAKAVAAIFKGGDVKKSLDAAASQADGLIADYNARNGGWPGPPPPPPPPPPGPPRPRPTPPPGARASGARSSQSGFWAGFVPGSTRFTHRLRAQVRPERAIEAPSGCDRRAARTHRAVGAT